MSGSNLPPKLRALKKNVYPLPDREKVFAANNRFSGNGRSTGSDDKHDPIRETSLLYGIYNCFLSLQFSVQAVVRTLYNRQGLSFVRMFLLQYYYVIQFYL